MLDLALLVGFSYALYRLAEGHNITPWKWIIRFVVTFFVSVFTLTMVLFNIYGENMMKDITFLAKISIKIEPLLLLYQVVLFFFFRARMLKYVHDLDKIDRISDTPPSPPRKDKDKEEEKDFSYFR